MVQRVYADNPNVDVFLVDWDNIEQGGSACRFVPDAWAMMGGETRNAYNGLQPETRGEQSPAEGHFCPQCDPGTPTAASPLAPLIKQIEAMDGIVRGKVECQNCEWTGDESEVNEIEDFHQRVNPGEVCPVGECPKCGALAHYAGGEA